MAKSPMFYFVDLQRPIFEASWVYRNATGVTEPELLWMDDENFLPEYGIVTSQTCDIAEEDSARPLRSWVLIAPVYKVQHWKLRRLLYPNSPMADM